MSDNATTKVVYVGADATHVPDVGDFAPGEIKDVDNEQLEWLTASGESEFFKVHVPASDEPAYQVQSTAPTYGVQTTADEHDLTDDETGK